MPRVYTRQSDPIDFCKSCMPDEEEAIEEFDTKLACHGDGPDGRGNCFGWMAEHPPYEGEDYHCEECRKLLTEEDN